ncbi:MAG TPA: NUDIX hydrolase [Mycobacterium sp.]|nr:NUDIX hydrolase [Mycobacterium sp.]
MSVRDSVIETLTSWAAPDFPQRALAEAVLSFVLGREDSCLRECVPGHITASALLVDDTGTQALLTLHPRLGRWVQLGGHCEPADQHIVGAARREAIEESGVDGLVVDPDLLALHVHPITCSLGVPTRHLDMQFLAYAPPDVRIEVSDESLDLRWWPLDALPTNSDAALAQLVSLARRRMGRHTSVE